MRPLLTPGRLTILLAGAAVITVGVMGLCCLVGTETVSLRAVFAPRVAGS